MRFQFTLQTLLLSAVVIWSSMAVFGAGAGADHSGSSCLHP
jgi:hypothetical protein